MSNYNKYLKYKEKYLYLKNLIGGTNDFLYIEDSENLDAKFEITKEIAIKMKEIIDATDRFKFSNGLIYRYIVNILYAFATDRPIEKNMLYINEQNTMLLENDDFVLVKSIYEKVISSSYEEVVASKPLASKPLTLASKPLILASQFDEGLYPIKRQTHRVYHGTSLYYYDYIKTYGLSGKFPEDIYEDIKYAYDKGYGRKREFNYIKIFIERTEEYKNSGKISISTTPQLAIAREYAYGPRRGGEGLRFMLNELYKDPNLSPELIRIRDKLQTIANYPGIILALQLPDNETINYDASEYVLNVSIPPNKLKIVIGEGDFIHLLSPEADLYRDQLMKKAEI